MNLKPLLTHLATLVAAGAPPLSAASVLDEVIVTARKHPEAVGTVPLHVDTLDAQTLSAGGPFDAASIAARFPGLGYEAQFSASGGVPTLRGLSQPTVAGDNVGIFVDGVYQVDRRNADIDLLDIERVELTRGPQSTLFGHSTFAGALHYVSRLPDAERRIGAAVDVGSDGWRAVQGFIGGAIHEHWAARFAAAHRSAAGNQPRARDSGEIGGFDRSQFALSLVRLPPDDGAWQAKLLLRHGQGRAHHPAVHALTGADYNCGALDVGSRQWSYHCGDAPLVDRFAISGQLPASRGELSQVALQMAWRIGDAWLESDTSAYRSHSASVRDFDASTGGDLYGVCTLGRSCPVPGRPPALLDRTVRINQVQVQEPLAREWSQELRLRRDAEQRDWLLGATRFETRERNEQRLGAANKGLAANEQLTAWLPGAPQLVGPVSQLNRARVDDPAALQQLQTLAFSTRRTLALFGAYGSSLTARTRLRLEWRYTVERLAVDSALANFTPSFGRSIPAQTFRDFTPRFSLDARPTDAWLLYASVSKGSRSGGVNLVPNLLPAEQSFRSEFNWTADAGAKFSGDGWLRKAEATLYHIDWRDTQILGFSATPGITNLITVNTAGVRSRGAELSAQLVPKAWLAADLSMSYVDARFRPGSDDPGASAFCGLSGASVTSNFCTLGAPRRAGAAGPSLVPWLDGNVVSRTPQLSWAALFTAYLRTPNDPGQWSVQIGATGQGAMFERGIEALRFGERTLVSATLRLAREPWTAEFWCTNLTDERYIRSSFSRQPQFFPTQPRPIDMIYGDRRRFGLSLRWQR
jgi:iron complex outermembrane recepter protein